MSASAKWSTKNYAICARAVTPYGFKKRDPLRDAMLVQRREARGASYTLGCRVMMRVTESETTARL